MTTTDSVLAILGALLVTGEALEASLAGAFSALWTLLSKVLLTDKAASIAGAEVTRVLVTARALVLTDIAEEALIAVADWLELVVDCALATARAQILVAVAWAEQVALASQEAWHALALGNTLI